MNRSVEAHLLNPPPDSAAARARDFGIDLTLLLGRLKLTPDERLRELQRVMIEFEGLRAGFAQGNDSSLDSVREDNPTVNQTRG